MPLVALPSLPAVVAKLSHRPAIPFSLNLLYVLLAPFCPAPSAADPPAATWEAVEAYYEPGTKAFWFKADDDDDDDAWAVILTHEIGHDLIKVHSALSDPSPDSASREGLFKQIMSHLKTTRAGKTVSFGGVPDGLQPTFDDFVEEPKGTPGRSFKVQKTLDAALAPGKVLDNMRFVADNLTRDEIPWALDTFKSSYKPEAFDKTVHFTSCIRDLSTSERKPVSWCLVYEDLSIAALCTLPGHRGASLAHHTVTNLASLLRTAFARMPAELQLALPGDEGHPETGNGPAWLVADWNEGNPLGQGFFTGEGFEKLEEAVRWSRGKL